MSKLSDRIKRVLAPSSHCRYTAEVEPDGSWVVRRNDRGAVGRFSGDSGGEAAARAAIAQDAAARKAERESKKTFVVNA